MDEGDDISPSNHESENYSRKKANNPENAEEGVCQIEGVIMFIHAEKYLTKMMNANYNLIFYLNTPNESMAYLLELFPLFGD